MTPLVDFGLSEMVESAFHGSGSMQRDDLSGGDSGIPEELC